MGKWSDLPGKAKGGIIAGGITLAAIGTALGITQPWKQPAPPPDPTPQIQTQPDTPEPEQLTLTVGKEQVPCSVYEGDGWSIYLPDGWSVEKSTGGDGSHWALFPGTEAPDFNGAYLSVSRLSDGGYDGKFISASRRDGGTPVRTFYTGGAGGGWEVQYQAPEADWQDYRMLMEALARTFTVGNDKPFEKLFPAASEPEWQQVEGKTVLWMDKDGYVVDDAAEEFVREAMLQWPEAARPAFTGRYRLENLAWSGEYTCLPGREYVDVFSCQVWYQAAEGQEKAAADFLGGDQLVEDGFVKAHEQLDIYIYHDGGSVDSTRLAWGDGSDPGSSAYAAEAAAQ